MVDVTIGEMQLVDSVGDEDLLEIETPEGSMSVSVGQIKEESRAAGEKTLRAEEDIQPLPTVGERANKILGFDDQGNPIAVEDNDSGVSEEVVDQKIGQGVSQGINSHNDDAEAHPGLREFITSEADRAGTSAQRAEDLVLVKDYAGGLTLHSYSNLVRDENGQFWRVSGQVDLPYVTTGAGIPEDDALVPVGDAVLRQDLANPEKGANLVSMGPGKTVADLEDRADPAKGAAMVGFESVTVHDRLFRDEQSTDLSPTDSSAKILIRATSDKYFVGQHVGGKNYRYYTLQRNLVTSVASVGGNGGLLRVTDALSAGNIVLGVSPSEVVGAWTRLSVSTRWGADISRLEIVGQDALFGQMWRGREGQDSIKFTVSPDDKGYVSATFMTATAGALTDVLVNGEKIAEVDCASTGGIKLFTNEFFVGGHEDTYEVEFRLQGEIGVIQGNFYLAGMNIRSIDEDRKGWNSDSCFIAKTNAGNYISHPGASDYAFRSKADNIWAGSYHGGETLIEEKLLVDNYPVTLEPGDFSVGGRLDIQQTTKIEWEVDGVKTGEFLDSRTSHSFDVSAGYVFSAAVTGNAELTMAYTCMSTTPTSFTDIIYPRYHRLTANSEPDTFLGWPGTVIQQQASTGRKVINQFTVFNRDRSFKGGEWRGAFVSNGFTNGYFKLYYGYAANYADGVLVDNLAFSCKKQFV